jgi:hypothetical protein
VSRSRLAWGAKNGLTLGCGAFSRVGFWLWYAVPAGALLTATPVLGALLYGTYGLVRGLGPWGLVYASRLRGWDELRIELVAGGDLARAASALALTVLAVATIVAVAL